MIPFALSGLALAAFLWLFGRLERLGLPDAILDTIATLGLGSCLLALAVSIFL